MLFLVPLRQELNHLVRVFMSAGWRIRKTQVQGFWFWCFPDQSLILALGGCGAGRFENQTRFCIQHLHRSGLDFRGLSKRGQNERSNQSGVKKIRHIFCLGSAGALDRKLEPGDLVCATRIIQYHWPENSPPTRQYCKLSNPPAGRVYGGCGSGFPVHETSEGMIKILKTKAKGHSLCFGPVVSVNKEVAGYENKIRILKDTGGMAVAREGVGGLKAAQSHGLSFTEIRAVTDQASENVHTEFQKNLQGAMKKLGGLIVDFFDRSPFVLGLTLFWDFMNSNYGL